MAVSGNRVGLNFRRFVRSPVRVFAFLALAGAGALCASFVAVGLFLSSPATGKVGAPPADLAFETVTIISDSGATLRGWFLSGRPGGGTVVLMHGVRANRLSMVERARLLHASGFSVFLFDFQAHGESGGKRIAFGHLEALDAAAAVAFVRSRLPDEKIGVIGASLGGAAALLGPRPLPVDALVLEAVYSDIGAATANRIRSALGRQVGPLVAEPLSRLLTLVMSPILGVAPDELRPVDRIRDVVAPVLILSGTRDTRTTLRETMAMYDRAPEPKSLWLVDGAGHVDLERYAPDAYRTHVLTFLAHWLQHRR
jgi:fermentation-respiration switch protein FrsA (DUF1100 family)